VNDAIALLMREHRTIERVLDALDVYADAVADGGGDPADLARFVGFLRQYADAHHHAKEEDILFVAMTDHGFPRDAGPVAVMLQEHRMGRELVATLADLASSNDWSGAARTRVREVAHGFTELLRHHIQKEDNVLYPMALSRLPAAAAEHVGQQCAARQADAADSGMLAKFDDVAGELTKRYTR
jgi:hemerythrin-like domain-containing protein